MPAHLSLLPKIEELFGEGKDAHGCSEPDRSHHPTATPRCGSDLSE